MTYQTIYPVLVGVIDLAIAGLLLVAAPALGFVMAIVGILVVGTVLVTRPEYSAPTSQSDTAVQLRSGR